MATDVDCGRYFEAWIIPAIKIHKHLHRNASFLSTEGGHLSQHFSFRPGAITVGILLLPLLEAMVLRDKGPLGRQGVFLVSIQQSGKEDGTIVQAFVKAARGKVPASGELFFFDLSRYRTCQGAGY